MKKLLILLFALIMTVALALSLASCGEDNVKTVTIKVYNWGEYISDGEIDEDGNPTYDTNAEFSEYFSKKLENDEEFAKKIESIYGEKVKIKVSYSTYPTNEDMYTKISSGAASYDIIIPSDYMIKRLADEGLLYSFGAENIENYKYIDEAFKNASYDKFNQYSVPYTYGMVGIIYNYTLLDSKDLDENGNIINESWNLMWNEGYNGDYTGKILQFNNPRDAFATAMYKAGININSDNPEDWKAALDLLVQQKPLVQAYVSDEIFNKMTSASAAIAAYYAGDFITMYEDNEYLKFYYPKEGTNYFVDAMCIPEASQHKEVAMEYINFMLSRDAAVANALAIGYASPNTQVRNDPEYIEAMTDIHPDAIEILYGMSPEEANVNYGFAPDYASFTDTSFFNVVTLDYVSALWEELKIESAVEPWIHIVSGTIVLTVVTIATYSVISRRIRSRDYRKRDKMIKKAKLAKK